MPSHPRIIVAGVRGGSGKTTLSLALITALRSQKGLKVVPFKKGPDYIDAGWMSLAAGNPCYNLDPFLIPRDKIMGSFLARFSGDIAVVEGNRGLHDGMDAEGSYSTAELAKLLKCPVILIVDCTKMTRTAAAVVLGCMNLDKGVALKGVVLNQVSGSRHEAVVRSSIEKYCGLPVLGAFPRLKSDELPERHMGLTPFQEHPDTARAISILQEMAGKYLDVDKIFSLAAEVENLGIADVGPDAGRPDCKKEVRIGIIRDSAFQFYYPENLEELEKNGAEIVDINAIEDSALPDIDALYIGGGFPETNAIDLAKNSDFRNSLREAVEKGLPVYAECGGLMFLGKAIIVDKERYPMTGIFPVEFEMKKKPQAHGYTVVEADLVNPFYPVGTELRGHEFHYSAVTGIAENESIFMAFKMKRGHGIMDRRDGLCYKNVLATYTHIHALGAPQWVAGFINKAKEYNKLK